MSVINIVALGVLVGILAFSRFARIALVKPTFSWMDYLVLTAMWRLSDHVSDHWSEMATLGQVGAVIGIGFGVLGYAIAFSIIGLRFWKVVEREPEPDTCSCETEP